MEYLELKEMNEDELIQYIEYIKTFQIEKFKNGINTNNWNQKEIIIKNDIFFVNDLDLKKYVENNFEKNSILCLKLYEFPQYNFSCQTGQEIYDNIIELEYETNNEFYLNLINRVKEQKSLTKSCNNCKSIIKIEYINYSNCPVCKDDKFLFNETDKQILENKINRLNKHKENYKDKSNKYYEKCEKKVNLLLNNKLENNEIEKINYKWVLVYDLDNIEIDENDINLLNLRLNAYREIYK